MLKKPIIQREHLGKASLRLLAWILKDLLPHFNFSHSDIISTQLFFRIIKSIISHFCSVLPKPKAFSKWFEIFEIKEISS